MGACTIPLIVRHPVQFFFPIFVRQPGNPEFAACIIGTVATDIVNDRTAVTAGFFPDIAPVAVRLHEILTEFFKAVKILNRPGSHFEIFLARTA
jgi:hypothetical protein